MGVAKRNSIGLGVSGGIAAYKAVEVMRLLQKSGCDVMVAMTRHATEFVRPLTFKSLTDKHVIVDDYAPDNPDPIAHINFSRSIDLLLIVPATANIIAKFANGIADDFLSSTYLASTAQVLVAPAMNTTMWEQPATRRNIERLKADGVRFVEPVAGELACKTIGTGKLEDVENIVRQAMEILSEPGAVANGPPRGGLRASEEVGTAHDISLGLRLRASRPVAPAPGSDLRGERILITVGGTREAIDPVRYITNHSSGKMGFAMAEAARDRGAEVTVIAGATTAAEPSGVKVVRATSAEEMYYAVMRELPNATVYIGTAAVADFRPAAHEAGKIKKDNRESFSLDLVRTRDILADVSKNRTNGLLVVGFAAETSKVVDYARQKLKQKDLDMIVANDVSRDGAGFDTDTNIATVITRLGVVTEIPLMSKRDMAEKVLDEVVKLRKDANK